jgi:hypothetical protein
MLNVQEMSLSPERWRGGVLYPLSLKGELDISSTLNEYF